MKISITYPKPDRQRMLREKLIRILRGPFLFTALLCPVMNLVTGGKAWSVIVLFSLYLVWTVAISPDLVEYNRISQAIRLIVSAGILLILIDRLLAPGWAVEAVPIVCFSGLAAVGVLFFTDFERQKQNMLPMLLLILLSLLAAIVGLIVWREESRWALAVMGVFAFSLLVCCIRALGPDFLRELQKRFHTK